MPTHPRPLRVAARRRSPFVAGVVALLALAASLATSCGADTVADGPAGSGPGGRVAVKLGVLPIADVAPIWYGIERGLFAAENLDVETVSGTSGADVVQSVVSGEYQFGFSNVVSLMLAREQGNDVRIVSNLVNGADRPDRGTNALLVAPGRGIDSLDDLAGKKFGVSSLKNAGEVTIKATLRNAGVDISDLTFLQYRSADMNAAVQSGQIDVAWQAEPFITLGRDAGLEAIADPMYATTPNLTIASVFASDEYLGANADTAARFQRAMARSIDEARRDEAGVRQTIATKTQTPPAMVPRIALANWHAEVNTASIELQADLAEEFGLLQDEPDTTTLVWSP
jgi:NitT/TauT family transport system substrate-binding protein